MARIHRRLYTKDLHDPDNHHGVITHLEPDILECEVKWALGSTSKESVANLDSILQSRDIALPTKVHMVKAVIFPVDK